jgi:hypothetical protein
MHQDTDKSVKPTAAGTPDPATAPTTKASSESQGKVPEVDQLKALLKVLGDWWNVKLPIPRRRPAVVDELSFADVVGYFAEQHPGDPRIEAGALLCQPHPKGQLVFLVFLDGKDRPCRDASGTPYGRRMVAASFDAELTGRLRGDQMLIFR